MELIFFSSSGRDAIDFCLVEKISPNVMVLLYYQDINRFCT